MTNSRTPFYKIGMASTPLYQEKKDDYNPNTGEKVTNESTTSIKTSINGRKGTLTTSRRDFASPGNAGTGGKERMSNNEWSSFVKANPDWNKGSNRSSKKESFTPDPESPMDLPNPKPTTFGNGLTGQPVKPIPNRTEPEKPSEETFGGENTARFSIPDEKPNKPSSGGGGSVCGCH